MSVLKPLLLLTLLSGVPAFAGTATGQVTQVIARASDGLVYFYLDGAPTGRAGCGGSTAYWMIKDENSATGTRQLAMILMARATGQAIKVHGTGTCTRWSDGEDVDYIRL